MRKKDLGQALVALACAGVLVAAAAAAEPEESAAEAEKTDRERIEALEEKVDVVVDEFDLFRKIFAVPEDREVSSFSGLGPYASKVYQRDRGLSIGGYGEVRFRGQVGDEDGTQDVFDALRGVLYVGYKFNDWIVMNGEYEFEHAGSGGGGEVSIEFLTLDFLLCDCFNVRAGLVLLPMGFVNEIHEPVFFYGAARPEVERRILPSTWRENGAGVFGSFLDDRIQYRMYAVNGFDATGFGDDGLRGGRQKGSEALADHFAFVGRVDVELFQGATVGSSVYVGNSGQNQPGIPDTQTTVWEVHGQLKHRGAHVRGLYTMAHLEDTAALSAAVGSTVAERMTGGYVEFAYDLLPMILPETEMSLEPFYRYEHLDTQDRIANGLVRNGARDRDIHTVGLQFKPHPQVVIKLDYRNFDSATAKLPDEVQAGIGFVF